MTHNEMPKINFIISENILAMSQIFLSPSAIYYFYFVATSRNNYIVNSISIDHGHYTVHQLTVLTQKRKFDPHLV